MARPDYSFVEFMAMSMLLGFSYRYVFPLHTGVWWSWVVVVAWCVAAVITVVHRFIDIEFDMHGDEE